MGNLDLSQPNPLRKTQGLIIEKMGDDQLVYHTERSQAFHLNPTLGQIWELCDGHRDLAAICASLPHLEAADVEKGLQQLSENGLLQSEAPLTGVSRRKLLKGLGRAAVAAPLLTMVAVPAGVAAASAAANPCTGCGGVSGSRCPNGCACIADADCQAGSVCTGFPRTCQPT